MKKTVSFRTTLLNRFILAAILCTGFSHHFSPAGALPRGIRLVLEKPVQKTVLAQALSALIPG